MGRFSAPSLPDDLIKPREWRVWAYGNNGFALSQSAQNQAFSRAYSQRVKRVQSDDVVYYQFEQWAKSDAPNTVYFADGGVGETASRR
ncbi:MAG: hypothetical protein U0528_21315 [Anaerolineae bacterium]